MVAVINNETVNPVHTAIMTPCKGNTNACRLAGDSCLIDSILYTIVSGYTYLNNIYISPSFNAVLVCYIC